MNRLHVLLIRRKMLVVWFFIFLQYELAMFAGLLVVGAITGSIDVIAEHTLEAILAGVVVALLVERFSSQRMKVSPFLAVAFSLATGLIQATRRFEQ